MSWKYLQGVAEGENWVFIHAVFSTSSASSSLSGLSCWRWKHLICATAPGATLDSFIPDDIHHNHHHHRRPHHCHRHRPHHRHRHCHHHCHHHHYGRGENQGLVIISRRGSSPIFYVADAATTYLVRFPNPLAIGTWLTLKSTSSLFSLGVSRPFASRLRGWIVGWLKPFEFWRLTSRLWVVSREISSAQKRQQEPPSSHPLKIGWNPSPDPLNRSAAKLTSYARNNWKWQISLPILKLFVTDLKTHSYS